MKNIFLILHLLFLTLSVAFKPISKKVTLSNEQLLRIRSINVSHIPIMESDDENYRKYDSQNNLNHQTITLKQHQLTIVHHHLNRVFWMHLEKCGTVFGILFYLYICPGAVRLIQEKKVKPRVPWHGGENITIDYMREVFEKNKTECLGKSISPRFFPHHTPYNPRFRGSAVTVFRLPESRLISSFMYNPIGGRTPYLPVNYLQRRDSDLSENPRPALTRAQVETLFREKLKPALNNSTTPIKTYADFAGMHSCQAKMLLGFSCGADVHLTRAEIEEAKRRLAWDFAFVGLTEEFEATLALFHRQFGVSHAGAAKLENTDMRINYRLDLKTYNSLRQQLQDTGYSDDADQEIYEFAAAVFYSRCRHYGVKTRLDILNAL